MRILSGGLPPRTNLWPYRPPFLSSSASWNLDCGGPWHARYTCVKIVWLGHRALCDPSIYISNGSQPSHRSVGRRQTGLVRSLLSLHWMSGAILWPSLFFLHLLTDMGGFGLICLVNGARLIARRLVSLTSDDAPVLGERSYFARWSPILSHLLMGNAIICLSPYHYVETRGWSTSAICLAHH
ncbi:hypothetical protein GGR54DRAFT_538911 [Hypoxylon sp. NC1633]|nr:hypothetical protein GGR54DRAFT_538911 [Hypoxylon sp. NC1633]